MTPLHWPTPVGGWPEWLWTVPYDAAQHPRAARIGPIGTGANCQRFATDVLALFGIDLPPLRSSELWTAGYEHPKVDALEALDLVLFHDTGDAWGAHVAIHMAPRELLHLSAEVGFPAVWDWRDFASRPRYASIVGAVRVTNAAPPRPRQPDPAPN